MTGYRGRFAPSPTGRLHIGSLTSALASYLDTKANNGKWLVRMEDLDPPREIPGAADSILMSLKSHGLLWDEPVIWQSQRHEAYQATIDKLLQSNQAFYCHCSRTDLKDANGIHTTACQPPPDLIDCAIRLRVGDESVTFKDRIQGSFDQPLNTTSGDFILQRKDQLFAYQLAVVIDDAYQNITHCLRGSDLLDSTPKQIFLQQRLDLPALQYTHIPVITNAQHQKLSKQNHAKELDDKQSEKNLLTALRYLNQPPPNPSMSRNNEDILRWATDHWSLEHIPKTLSLNEIQ